MEENKVIISLKEYNNFLRMKEELKSKIKQGFTFIIPSYKNNGYAPCHHFITTNDAVKIIAEENAALLTANQEIRNERDRYKQGCQEERSKYDMLVKIGFENMESNVDLKNKLKKMSILEFIKWRKKQNLKS